MDIRHSRIPHIDIATMVQGITAGRITRHPGTTVHIMIMTMLDMTSRIPGMTLAAPGTTKLSVSAITPATPGTAVLAVQVIVVTAVSGIDPDTAVAIVAVTAVVAMAAATSNKNNPLYGR